jgi:cation diffusion facilitator family transporter
MSDAGTLGRTKRRAAAVSIASNTFLILTKLTVGVITRSVAVISEAVHSAMDLLAALIAYVAVTISDRPPDREHQHGHGKVESLSGAIEALLIFGAVFFIAYESIDRLVHGSAVEKAYLGSAVMGLSATVNTVVFLYLQRVGRLTESEALLADAAHLRTDVYTSLGVLAGLLIVHFTRLQWLDQVTALSVALLIVWEAWLITRRAVGNLLDRSLPEEEQRLLEEVITQSGATFHAMRSWRSGSTRKVDLHLDVSPNATAGEVHDLCDRIEQSVEQALPGAQVLIHPEPAPEKDATAAARRWVERILEQHSRMFLRYSELEVTMAGERVQVGFRLALPHRSRLEQVEEVCRHLEQHIREHVPDALVYIAPQVGARR